MTWLRRAGGQGNRKPRKRQAAREHSRRTYRPYAEWLEDRTVLSPAPVVSAATLTAPPFGGVSGTGPAKSTSHGSVFPKPGPSSAPAAPPRLPDFTALLFATETPDLPAIQFPAPTTPVNALVQTPKIGVYPVPPASRPTSPGPSGGIIPQTDNGGSYQVFFSPSSLFQATVGEAFEGPVATVTVPGDSKPEARYHATIDWGDGTTATTGVIHVTGKHVGVEGRHTYTQQGHFAVQVHIEVDSTVLGNVAGTATAAPAVPVQPPSDKPVPEAEFGPMSMRSSDSDKWSTVVMAAATFAFAPQATWPTRQGSRVLTPITECPGRDTP